MKNIFRNLSYTIAIVVCAGSAHAESCSELALLSGKIKAAKLRLVADYPGTSATMFACFEGSKGQTDSDRQSMMLFCGAGVALALGFEETFKLIGRVVEIADAETWMSRKMREGNCR